MSRAPAHNRQKATNRVKASPARSLVGASLVYNGNFAAAPSSANIQTAQGTWIDGTTPGSATNTTYGLYLKQNTSPSNSVQFVTNYQYTKTNVLRIIFVPAGIIDVTTTSTIFPGLTTPNSTICKPNTTYTLKADVYVEAISGSATNGISLQAWQSNGDGITGTAIASPYSQPSLGLSTLTYTFMTGPNTNYLSVGLIGNGRGGLQLLTMTFAIVSMSLQVNPKPQRNWSV